MRDGFERVLIEEADRVKSRGSASYDDSTGQAPRKSRLGDKIFRQVSSTTSDNFLFNSTLYQQAKY